MNTVIKLSVASALALGYTAAQAQIAAPGTGSSDLILFAEIINSSGVEVASYARDTGISISSVMSSLQAEGTAVPSGGFTSLSLPAGLDIAPDANMTSFLSHDATGDVVEWTIMAAQYTGTNTTGNFGTNTNAQFITGSPSGFANLSTKNTGNLTHWAGTSSNFDGVVTSVNANIKAETSNPDTNSVFSTAAATGGIWDPTQTSSSSNMIAWFANGPTTFPATLTNQLGTSETLYGVTGNGTSSTTKVAYYNLGSITLTNSGALMTAGSPVPLPGAIWLLGSALLGLAGVGRRRTSA